MYIDARGQECPRPVIHAKKALEGNAMDPVTVAVDNALAVENLEKMSLELGHSAQSRQLAGDHFEVTITPEGAKAPDHPTTPAALPVEGAYTVLVASHAMGSGDDTLGAALMKGFLFALTELPQPPERLIFLNGGARFTCEGSPSLPDLEALEQKGCRIHTCGTCLNFYRLEDTLRIGGVSNMYEIAGFLARAEKVIRP